MKKKSEISNCQFTNIQNHPTISNKLLEKSEWKFCSGATSLLRRNKFVDILCKLNNLVRLKPNTWEEGYIFTKF